MLKEEEQVREIVCVCVCWEQRRERERELGSIMEPQVARQLGSWLSVSKMGDFLTVNKSLKLGSRRFLRANRVAI